MVVLGPAAAKRDERAAPLSAPRVGRGWNVCAIASFEFLYLDLNVSVQAQSIGSGGS